LRIPQAVPEAGAPPVPFAARRNSGQESSQLCANSGFELKTMDHHTPEQRERLWRRKLSAAERAELRGEPEVELEARLTEALAQLPDSPVPSNFTARVLAAVELEEARAARPAGRWGWRWNWHSLLPRLAVACAVLLFAGVGLQHHELARHRTEMARSLAAVATTSAIPSLDALENLEAIQRMSQPARADTDLLAALE
jgi:hypothetical protein